MKHPFRRLKRNRKGGASVAIALIMAMIVVISFVNNIILWGYVMSAEDRDRLNERIEIEVVQFTPLNVFEVEVRNIGSVTTHIVAVYLEPLESGEEIRYGLDSGIDFYLGLDEVKNVWPRELFPKFGMLDDFVVTVLTERGNSDSKIYTYETSPPYMPEVGELGVFRANWFYSKYSSLQTGGERKDAVLINKTDDYVAFYVEIKNIWDRPCGIRSDSFMALTSIQPTDREPNFFIVHTVNYSLSTPEFTLFPISNGTEGNPYTTYIIDPQESITLTFVARSELGGTREDEWSWGFGYPFGQETTMEASGILISLFYDVYIKQWEGQYTLDPSLQTYGQTISTQACILQKK